MLYNKKTFREALEEQEGIQVSDTTLWLHEKKGYLTPSDYFPDGKRRVPVYDDKVLKKYANKLRKLKEQGKVKINIE